MNTDALRRDLARAHLLSESLLRTDHNRPDVQATIAKPPINPGSLAAQPTADDGLAMQRMVNQLLDAKAV